MTRLFTRMKSRRNDFRYGEFQYRALVRTAYEDGTCLLKNISTSGCALQEVSTRLTLMDSFLLVIETDEILGIIEARCKVIRIKDTTYGVQFTRLSENSKNLIRKYFASKLRNH